MKGRPVFVCSVLRITSGEFLLLKQKYDMNGYVRVGDLDAIFDEEKYLVKTNYETKEWCLSIKPEWKLFNIPNFEMDCAWGSDFY